MVRVTKLVGSEGIEFEQAQYEAEVRENSSPGPLLRLAARVPHPAHARFTDNNNLTPYASLICMYSSVMARDDIKNNIIPS
ncbi:hypothetical protein Pcinc_041127 [Petrolisthes cinctipes]|uniref:Uncharacterized protein n=1 Tax=Petrolisthes cinctipes TaxID=88211 RepID=A0AAE1EI31_PETCI|nr:hypothetical protein Pcinc_041127 [Petrolisthes cinctipes]